ncbi:MAG: peptidoglycan DD-metalloendopeptidase family protein [Chitinophagaceae bacterium]
MKLKSYFLYLFCFLFNIVDITMAQIPGQRQPDGGNGYLVEKTPCLSESQRQEIIKKLKENTIELQAKGTLNLAHSSVFPSVKFIWPVQQTTGYNDPGFYGISNFVDEDTAASVLDYGCGTRSYNEHRGTDIFTWPFTWTKMDSNAVQVVAAAGGTIIGKSDGIPDKSCAFCPSCNWNAVYILNTDGSICWYGHMKTGSVSTKPIGAFVAQGEYLGIVGSSGNSTGPHLHFEVYNDYTYTQLIDPWQGACNKNGNTSLWTSQQSYYVPSINKIATHNAAPVLSTCYGTEAANYSNTFVAGSVLYYAVYLRDQQPSTSGLYTILRPDNSIYTLFTQPFTVYYAASYWYWSQTLPSNAPPGTWTFRFQYNGQTVDHSFVVTTPLPLTLLNFSAKKQNNYVQLNWQTSNEQNIASIEIQRSRDGNNYTAIEAVAPTAGINSTVNNYAYTDANTQRGQNFYRLKIVDNDGQYTYSNIISIQLAYYDQYAIRLLGNPVKNRLSLLPNMVSGKAVMKIIDASGIVADINNVILQENVRMDIPVLHLRPGNYYLILDVRGQRYSMPFTKQ